MSLSYWEQNTWFNNIDFCIIGSGIVGLNCAVALRKDHPNAKILVLEKGQLPQGASSKNAGFACFGSMSELLSDLSHHSESEIAQLVQQRYEGLQLLRQNLGDKAIDYKRYGGYEIFLNKNEALFQKCLQHVKDINALLYPLFQADVFQIKEQRFGFKNSLSQMIVNPYEAQIDTGLMMRSLLQKAQSNGILVLNVANVISFSTDQNAVHIALADTSFKTKQLFIATNAFAQELLEVDVKPYRNQVIITEPIRDLSINGTFHLDQGYYYFRNIHNRILLGGGRHLDPERESTTDFGLTDTIQHQLENLLHEVILPDQPVNIAHRWSGILASGSQKKPIVKSIDDRVHCAVRLGGMGVAIGSDVGRRLADLSNIS